MNFDRQGVYNTNVLATTDDHRQSHGLTRNVIKYGLSHSFSLMVYTACENFAKPKDDIDEPTNEQDSQMVELPPQQPNSSQSVNSQDSKETPYHTTEYIDNLDLKGLTSWVKKHCYDEPGKLCCSHNLAKRYV